MFIPGSREHSIIDGACHLHLTYYKALPLAVAALALFWVAPANPAAADSDELLVELKTTQGSIFIDFFREDAPNHVDNFIRLADSGFYNGTAFHRIIANYMIQGGDPNTISGNRDTWGLGGTDDRLDPEFNTIKHQRGIVSMARTADPGSASTQFYILDTDAPFLNGQYTVFGRLATEGSFQTLNKILAVQISVVEWSARPFNPDQVRIISAASVPRSEVPDLLDLPEPARTPELVGLLNSTQAADAQLQTSLHLPIESPPAYPGFGVQVETVAQHLTVPWSIDWLPDGTAIFTERQGYLKMIQNGTTEPTALLFRTSTSLVGGMLGVTVDPNFEENNYIYLYRTYNKGDILLNKLVRYTLTDGRVANEHTVLDNIPGAVFENGGRIQFGPDGKIYITTGYATDPFLAQDPDSLAGKILRINPDGTVPDDNPIEGSPVWSMGHRHPQGLDWDVAGNLLVAEHGPSGWRSEAHDEINLIMPGANYGWPVIVGGETAEGLRPPLIHSGNDTWAPSGASFYDGDKIPEWTGKFFVAALRGTHLHMIDFDLENNVVVSHTSLFSESLGRLRDVQTGPDGYLYLLTSNQDGWVTPADNDDRILRIVPLSEPADPARADTFTSEAVYEGMVRVADTEYSLGYNITGGNVLGVEADTAAMSLMVAIDATEDGSLTLNIPRTVADSKLPEEPDYRALLGVLRFVRDTLGDAAFVVLIDGKEVDIAESASPYARTLTIEFHAGAGTIEITGNTMFGQYR